MILVTDLSNIAFDLLRKHSAATKKHGTNTSTNLYQPMSNVKLYWKEHDITVTYMKLYGKFIGFYVNNFMEQTIEPELDNYIADWKKANPGRDPSELVHIVKYKYGGDTFCIHII
jgi:hypothetical protein